MQHACDELAEKSLRMDYLDTEIWICLGREIFVRNVVLCFGILLGLVASVAWADDAALQYPKLDIYLITDEMPAPDGTETAATLRLRKIMAKVPELRYELHYVSWPKAMRQVERRPDALIFQMLRTPQREARFHWLVADQHVPINLVTLRSNPKKDWSLSRLKQSNDVQVACPATTAHCEILTHQGFQADQIIQISPQQQESVERVLIAGRVDFIVVAPADLQRNMQRLDVDASAYQISHQLTAIDDYLAGGLLLDPKVRALFRNKIQ